MDWDINDSNIPKVHPSYCLLLFIVLTISGWWWTREIITNNWACLNGVSTPCAPVIYDEREPSFLLNRSSIITLNNAIITHINGRDTLPHYVDEWASQVLFDLYRFFFLFRWVVTIISTTGWTATSGSCTGQTAKKPVGTDPAGQCATPTITTFRSSRSPASASSCAPTGASSTRATRSTLGRPSATKPEKSSKVHIINYWAWQMRLLHNRR